MDILTRIFMIVFPLLFLGLLVKFIRDRQRFKSVKGVFFHAEVETALGEIPVLDRELAIRTLTVHRLGPGASGEKRVGLAGYGTLECAYYFQLLALSGRDALALAELLEQKAKEKKA